MRKNVEIAALLRDIKSCRLCCNTTENGMTNIIAGRPESASRGIGYWSDAFPNYDANLLIVGQDFGDVKYVQKFGASPVPYREPGNPTWENLIFYLKEAGFETVDDKCEFKDLYLTNTLLCARKGNMSGNKAVDISYFDNCFPYLVRQIEIIEPRVIATLGKLVFDAFARHYALKTEKSFSAIANHEYTIEDGIILFPLYHTGYFGTLNAGGKPKMIESFRRLRSIMTAEK